MSCVTESIKTQQLEQKIAQITKERDAERKEKDFILNNYRILEKNYTKLEKDYTKLERYCDTIEKKLDTAVSNYSRLEKELIDVKEELDTAQTELDLEESMWKYSIERDPEKCDLQHALEFWERIINNPKFLYIFTQMEIEEFEYTLEKLGERVTEHPEEFSQYRDVVYGQGNVSRFELKYYLFMAIANLRCGFAQWKIAGLFDVNQSTVSRQIKPILQFLNASAAATSNIAAEISETKTFNDLKKLLNYSDSVILLIDGFEREIDIPKDEDKEKEHRSGKKRLHTYKKLIITTLERLILHVSPAEPGSVSEITILRKLEPGFGKWWKKMKNPRTWKKQQFIMRGDSAYQGFEGVLPGTKAIHPIKSSKNHPLTKKAKKFNRRHSRIRVGVENTIGMINQYLFMTSQIEGSKEQYDLKIGATAALINQHTLWDKEHKRPSERLIRLEESRKRRERRKFNKSRKVPRFKK